MGAFCVGASFELELSISTGVVALLDADAGIDERSERSDRTDSEGGIEAPCSEVVSLCDCKVCEGSCNGASEAGSDGGIIGTIVGRGDLYIGSVNTLVTAREQE